MKNTVNNSMWITLPIILFFLLSCVSTQQKQRDAEFYHLQGMGYLDKGQYDQAISDFNTAIEINPKDALAYGLRGLAYREKGQYDQAISDYTTALEINPRDDGAYYNRGVAYYSKQEYNKSWDDIKKAQDLGYKIPPEFLDKLRRALGREK
jgi:tetratricopeptide (TPR) repeat protein